VKGTAKERQDDASGHGLEGKKEKGSKEDERRKSALHGTYLLV
jgi:hypothetical protein